MVRNRLAAALQVLGLVTVVVAAFAWAWQAGVFAAGAVVLAVGVGLEEPA